MFQDYALFPWRTVLGNVEFGPLARGASREAMRSTRARYIELVGLAGFEHRYPHELSGGMRQRCALARLLANEPEVWLMDEPLAAVDLQTRNILQDELLRLWGDGGDAAQRRAVLFVTHGIDEAVYLSDRVLVLGRRPGASRKSCTSTCPSAQGRAQLGRSRTLHRSHLEPHPRRGRARHRRGNRLDSSPFEHHRRRDSCASIPFASHAAVRGGCTGLGSILGCRCSQRALRWRKR
jgi:ABC-type nitrate/sulfonate/bicarbonate transport system ATPase subunit